MHLIRSSSQSHIYPLKFLYKCNASPNNMMQHNNTLQVIYLIRNVAFQVFFSSHYSNIHTGHGQPAMSALSWLIIFHSSAFVFSYGRINMLLVSLFFQFRVEIRPSGLVKLLSSWGFHETASFKHFILAMDYSNNILHPTSLDPVRFVDHSYQNYEWFHFEHIRPPLISNHTSSL